MKAILLSGTSSSGKTSIARAIQNLAPVPFLHASVDAFTDMFDWDVIAGEALSEECDRAGVSLFHRALPALLSSRYSRVHRHGGCDLEVDTSRSLPEECARRILEAWAAGAPGGT